MKSRVRCRALMVNAFQCDARAKWWVWTVAHGAQPRCGTHARSYLASWPMVSQDPEADRLVAERMVRT